ncbi:DUF6708 domain-containing protein, partial [Pseudomonas sp. P5_C3]
MYDGRATTDYEALGREADLQKETNEKLPPIRVTQTISKAITDNESLYNYNPTYIDVRTPNDEKRGLITLIVGGVGAGLLWMFFLAFYFLATYYYNEHKGSESTPLSIIDFISLHIIPLIPITSLYLYIKYVFRYLRLEAFTARRLIVRFNRITRKIYLLRPKHLGGIVALDWDTAEVCINPKMSELDGTGGFVMLGWDKETHSVRDADGHLKDDFEITFVGKPTRNASELLAFWEYIRRYMEEGPEAAPKPKKLIGKFPWPWRSFMAVWQLDSRFVKIPQLWIFVPIYGLLLPLILVHACGHWVSLLL